MQTFYELVILNYLFHQLYWYLEKISMKSKYYVEMIEQNSSEINEK